MKKNKETKTGRRKEINYVNKCRNKAIQNREAFTDALLGEGVRYETAGGLQGGRKVYLFALSGFGNGRKEVVEIVHAIFGIDYKKQSMLEEKKHDRERGKRREIYEQRKYKRTKGC